MPSKWDITIVLGILLLGCLFFLALAPLRAQQGQEQDPAIKKIAMDWKRRLERSATIKYRVTGTTVQTKDYLAHEYKNATWKPKDVTLKRNFTMILDFQGKRQRTENDEESFNTTDGTISRGVLTTVFDGHSYRGSGKQFHDGVEQKRPESTDIGIMTKNFHFAKFDNRLRPLFAGHGIIMIPPRQEITMQNMAEETKIDDLVYVHGQGVHEGRACVVLRTQARKNDALSYSEYWVDPSRDSALVRQIVGGKYPVFEWNIGYGKTPVGWLVDSWTMTHRSHGSDAKLFTVSHSQFRVEERIIDYGAVADDFTLPVKPGMLVRRYSDQIEENHTFFRVDSSGTEHQVRFDGDTQRRVLGFQDYAVYSLLLLLLGLAVLAIWKLRGWLVKRGSANQP